MSPAPQHGAFTSPAVQRIDYDALIHNWRAIAKASGTAQTGAAVKANAYGLGARQVVKHLSASGCRDFFVAHWQEAAAISDIVEPEHISVLNGVAADDVQLAKSLGAVPVLNTPGQIQAWKAAGGGRCHVMIDTGINRLGIGPEQFSAELLNGLDIDIVMSHLASADEDSAQNLDQVRVFNALSSQINAKRRSLANSAAVFLGAAYHYDLTRPGLGLYGGVARPEMADVIKQVAFPQARILQLRTVKAGQHVGYNATYQCKDDMRVATASIGYADGYKRAFSNCGHCVFEGAEMPTIGRVSMDLITLDASAVPYLSEGDMVDVTFNLYTAAERTGISQYELLTGLGRRFG
jgi:alanine racemase